MNFSLKYKVISIIFSSYLTRTWWLNWWIPKIFILIYDWRIISEGVNCRLQVAGCRLQVAGAGCRLQVAGGRWQVAGAGCRLQVAGAGCRLQVAGAGCRLQVAGAGCRLQVAGCDHIFFQTEDVWSLYGTFLLKFLQENQNCFICKETLVMRNLNLTRLLVCKFAEPFQCVLADTPHSQFGMEILGERCGLIVNYWRWSTEAIMGINRHPL